MGVLDLIRGRIMVRIGASLDEALSERVYETLVRMPLKAGNRSDGLQPLRDLDNRALVLVRRRPDRAVRPALDADLSRDLFRFPFLDRADGACRRHDPVSLTVLTELWTRSRRRRRPSTRSRATGLPKFQPQCRSAGRDGHDRPHRRRAGPKPTAATFEPTQGERRGRRLRRDLQMLRMMLQSGVLAVGAWLVINQQATAGIIIAGSILSARALAPVDLAIANWKGFVAARQSWNRLNQLLRCSRPTRRHAAAAAQKSLGREARRRRRASRRSWCRM